MEILRERFLALKRSLDRFKESLGRLATVTDINEQTFYRDSVIQRFEFTYEVFWKFLRTYLNRKLMIDTAQMGNARMVLRASYEATLLSAEEFDLCLAMLEDRNQTSHTYEEAFAQELAERARLYAVVIETVLERIRL